MITVVLADDHAIFREGLARLLELEKDFQVVGEASNGREAITVCEALNPDVIILDFDMPDLDGLEVTKQLSFSNLHTSILILTMHASEEFALRLLQAGASGFLVKCSSAKILPSAIRDVAKGRIFIQPDMAENITARLLSHSHTSPTAILSDRELQIIAAIASGRELKEIALDFCISPRTVETHKNRAMRKLGLKNVAELVHFAIRHGLVKMK